MNFIKRHWLILLILVIVLYSAYKLAKAAQVAVQDTSAALNGFEQSLLTVVFTPFQLLGL